MDECTDMTISDAPGKNTLHFNSSPTAVIDRTCQNPFDRQFELARKQNINLRYAPSISHLNQTSPLNTPSISLNDGATPWIPLPTPMVPGSITEPESLKVTAAEETQPQTQPQGSTTKVTSSNSSSNQRSNVVSVICPPSATAKISEASSGCNSESASVKSAPVITESGRDNAAKGDPNNKTGLDDVRSETRPVPKSASELTCLRSYPRKNKLLAPITLLVSLPPSQEPPFTSIPVQVSSSCLPAVRSDRLVPKRDNCAAVNSATTIKPLNISSLPSRKKEKTEEELKARLKATEAALPPKAKPGRKSRSAAEEDVNQKKKRSLERNRAAAMRCRLKKKKEVDELKTKVEDYEMQNQDLRKIIDDLIKEVKELKSQLLRHKDCCD